jgi:putative sigma-54 modulation protein
MKIDVRCRGLETSDSFREHIRRRVHFQMSRFGGAVRSVVVRIGDINGPKGGADKRCQVTLRGSRLGPLTIEDLSADVYSALDTALERAVRAVGRDIERKRTARRENGAIARAS